MAMASILPKEQLDRARADDASLHHDPPIGDREFQGLPSQDRDADEQHGEDERHPGNPAPCAVE